VKILIVTPYFPPDLGPSASMIGMLSEDLLALGHEVDVVAAVPHFPSGRVDAIWRRGVVRTECRGRLRVHRVRVPSGDRRDLRHRAGAFAAYQLLAGGVVAGLECDAAIVTNPSLESGLPFLVARELRGLPIVWCVWDLYPEAGVSAGVFRGWLVPAVIRASEEVCQRRASAVQVLTDEMFQGLVGQGVPLEKLVKVPVWLDLGEIRPMARETDLSRQWGLTERFVVLYAGNVGLSQGLAVVLDAAERLRASEEILFLMVGEGVERVALEAEARRRGLLNVEFRSFVPRERLPELLASCDLGLVSLRRGVKGSSIPSKTFNLLSAGRPVVACVESGCELERLLTRSGAGLVVPAGSGGDLAEAIRRLQGSNELRAATSAAGRVWVERWHDRGVAAKAFDEVLKRIAA
jgi:colanic acid biosynthesis glycosyl transferase WcaI